MDNNFSKYNFIIITLTCFIFCFSLIIHNGINTDIQRHVRLFIADPTFQIATPLYRFLIYFISGFSEQKGALLQASIFLLYCFISLMLLGIIILQSFFYLKTDGKIAIDILFIHKQFSVSSFHDIIKYVLSIIFSLAIIVFCDKKQIRSDYTLQLSWALLFFSVIIAFVFIEDNSRKTHEIFYWQIHMSNFILFLVSTRYLNLDIKNSVKKVKDIISGNLLFTHFSWMQLLNKNNYNRAL